MTRIFKGDEGLTLVVLSLLIFVLFIVPLSLLAVVALGDGPGPIWEALDSRSVPRALWTRWKALCFLPCSP